MKDFSIYGLSKERIIHHSEQITNVSQLVVGESYKKYFPSGPRHFKFLKQVGEREIEIHLQNHESPIEAFLSDLGIIPYKSGYWNHTNYVIPCKD